MKAGLCFALDTMQEVLLDEGVDPNVIWGYEELEEWDDDDDDDLWDDDDDDDDDDEFWEEAEEFWEEVEARRVCSLG